MGYGIGVLYDRINRQACMIWNRSEEHKNKKDTSEDVDNDNGTNCGD